MVTLLLFLVFIILVPILVVISIYNGLVRRRNQVTNAEGTMNVQLKKRHDLIPNLVGAVKKFMEHEKELLTKLTGLRSKIDSASNAKELGGLEEELTSALGQFNVTVENYPDIKSNVNILQLQASLNEVEAQIAAARRSYNTSVTDYNDKIQVFPNSIIAGIFNFKKAEIFEISSEEMKNVDVTSLMG